MKVLVTGAGGPAGRSLIDQLSARDIPVVGVDMVPIESTNAVRTYLVPAATDPAMISVLQLIAEQEQVDVVIPTVSEELPLMAANRDSFGPDVHVAVADIDAVVAAHDKLSTCQALDSQGVAVPAFGIPGDFADADAAFAQLGGPLVVKPRVSRGGRGVVVADSPAELDWATLDDSVILQRFAPGTEYAPVVYQPLPGDANTPLVVVLEKVSLRQGRVGNAESVCRLPSGDAMDVANAAVNAVQALGLVGPVDVDVRRDADGRPRVLEVNARFGANSASAPELLDRVLTAFVRRRAAYA